MRNLDLTPRYSNNTRALVRSYRSASSSPLRSARHLQPQRGPLQMRQAARVNRVGDTLLRQPSQRHLVRGRSSSPLANPFALVDGRSRDDRSRTAERRESHQPHATRLMLRSDLLVRHANCESVLNLIEQRPRACLRKEAVKLLDVKIASAQSLCNARSLRVLERAPLATNRFALKAGPLEQEHIQCVDATRGQRPRGCAQCDPWLLRAAPKADRIVGQYLAQHASSLRGTPDSRIASQNHIDCQLRAM